VGAGAGAGAETAPTPPEVGDERDIELELYSARVRFLVRRYYAARAQSCFDRATRNDPSLHGTVVIDMTIGADGTVGRSHVARNTTGDEALGGCLASQVRSWRLSPPPGGELTMQMPFSR
jgi:TonB family protein